MFGGWAGASLLTIGVGGLLAPPPGLVARLLPPPTPSTTSRVPIPIPCPYPYRAHTHTVPVPVAGVVCPVTFTVCSSYPPPLEWEGDPRIYP